MQRGRGLGALVVSGEAPAPAPAPAPSDTEDPAQLVREVVRRDWRWDSVDDRHLYLARLIRESGLALGPVFELLAGHADDCERATRILESLALAGSGAAREGLREYVREGEHWVDVLESVADAWPVEWWDDLAGVARARLTGGEPLLWRSEPWVRWGVEARRDSSAGRPSRARVVDVGPSSPRLLAVLGDAGASRGEKIRALRALAGRPPEPGLLPLVPDLAEANGELPLAGLTDAVRRLGVLAVPEARAWAVDGRRWLS